LGGYSHIALTIPLRIIIIVSAVRQMEGTQQKQKIGSSEKLKQILRELEDISRRVENLERISASGTLKNESLGQQNTASDSFIDFDHWSARRHRID
jgi:hypothetical protein